MKNSRIVTAVILLTGAGLMALGLTRGELGGLFCEIHQSVSGVCGHWIN